MSSLCLAIVSTIELVRANQTYFTMSSLLHNVTPFLAILSTTQSVRANQTYFTMSPLFSAILSTTKMVRAKQIYFTLSNCLQFVATIVWTNAYLTFVTRRVQAFVIRNIYRWYLIWQWEDCMRSLPVCGLCMHYAFVLDVIKCPEAIAVGFPGLEKNCQN